MKAPFEVVVIESLQLISQPTQVVYVIKTTVKYEKLLKFKLVSFARPLDKVNLKVDPLVSQQSKVALLFLIKLLLNIFFNAAILNAIFQ